MNLFGKYLKNFLDEKNYKLEYAADQIGVSFGLLGHYINGRRSPSYKFLEKFFKSFNIKELEQKKIIELVEFDKMPDDLKKLREKKKKSSILNKAFIKLIEIPVYASVSAGCGRIPEREPIDYISLPEVSSDCIAIKVDGESMEPTLSPGDLIVLKKEMEVNIGDIGVFLNKTTGESFVKRLKNRNGNYILESDNSLFSDIEINTDEIYCCGKVINVVKSNLKNKKNQLQEIFDEIPSDKIELAKKLLKTLIP